MGMTGQRGRPPGSGLDVKSGDRFGPWIVAEAGLRLWQNPKDPAGRHAARCVCTCGGGTRTFRVTQLPGLAQLGPDCPGHKRGPARSGPDLVVKPGDRFGPWAVTRTGVRLYGRHAAACDCICGKASRTFLVYMLPGLAVLGAACPGHARGRPRTLPGIKPGDRFGPWTVTRTGVRLSGGVAAECVCTCGKGRRTVLLSKLAGLAKLGPGCPGHKRGRRKGSSPLTVNPGDRFGPWTVTRTGLRLHDRPAAGCECTCGTVTRTFQVSRLPSLVGLGQTCPGHGPALRPKAAKPPPARTPAAPLKAARPAPPTRPARPAPPRIPVGQIHAGLEIGGWKVLRDDLSRSGVTCLLIACTTCQHQRQTRRTALAAGQIRPCKHDYPEPAAPAASATPSQDRAHQWITANAPDGVVYSTDLAAGLGISRKSAQRLLSGLAVAGRITRPWHGAYALPGADPTAPDTTRREKIILFLAADGGGIFTEIQRATGIASGALTGFLVTMTRCGDIIRVEDRTGYFYLLPGQEPGERVEPPAAAS